MGVGFARKPDTEPSGRFLITTICLFPPGKRPPGWCVWNPHSLWGDGQPSLAVEWLTKPRGWDSQDANILGNLGLTLGIRVPRKPQPSGPFLRTFVNNLLPKNIQDLPEMTLPINSAPTTTCQWEFAHKSPVNRREASLPECAYYRCCLRRGAWGRKIEMKYMRNLRHCFKTTVF